MTGRREFLKSASAASALGAGAAHAGEIVRRGSIGRVAYCRVAHAGLLHAAALIAGADCVMEVEPGTRGVAVLGSRGTLVVTGGSCRVFGTSS